MHEPPLRQRARLTRAAQLQLVAHARAAELADAIAPLYSQCDSAQTPITSPAWMSSPPSWISQALMAVSKKE
jgi:hypothetical protein